MKRMILGISAVALALASAGFAAEEHGPADQSETRAEAQARTEHLFDKLDLNHDGVISRQEFAATRDAMMGSGHGPERPGMDGEHPGGRDGRMGRQNDDRRDGEEMVMLILQRADPGRTGSVTHNAFMRASLSLFDQADANHDGVLTSAEHRAFAEVARQQMQADMQERGGPDDDMPGPPPFPPESK